MENLTATATTTTLNELQQKYIREQLDRVKFTEIAKAAGCSVDDVRRFAAERYIERKREEVERETQSRAEAAKRAAEQRAAIKKLIDEDEGCVNRARALWEAANREEIAWDAVCSYRGDLIRNELVEDLLAEHEEEIDAQVEEAMSEEIEEALDEAWGEYLHDNGLCGCAEQINK